MHNCYQTGCRFVFQTEYTDTLLQTHHLPSHAEEKPVSGKACLSSACRSLGCSTPLHLDMYIPHYLFAEGRQSSLAKGIETKQRPGSSCRAVMGECARVWNINFDGCTVTIPDLGVQGSCSLFAA